MNEKEFNLLHEPWILVLNSSEQMEEISIIDFFKNAHKYKRLAGELPTQDIAILRLLLAIAHSVFARYDINGENIPFDEPSDAIVRWSELWNHGKFPMEIIEEYLIHFEERFWLFHPEYPFYQVAAIKDRKTTDYGAKKLNGEISESENKIRLFSQRTGVHKDTLTYPEAARWLIYVNAFDDTSSKPQEKGKKLPSTGAGWLGKLGLISVTGDNCFETLVYNLVFLKDGELEVWGKEKPWWENKSVKADERTEIALPDNQSELLTLQSRRLFLVRDDNGNIVKYNLLGGDFFQKENAFVEQMTLWRNASKRKDSAPEYHPKRHDPSRQMWRDFSSLLVQNDGERAAGVVKWISFLKRKNIISSENTSFEIASVKYGDKDFFVENVFSDSLSFNSDILSELGEEWLPRIVNEVTYAESLVTKLAFLASDLTKAAGNRDSKYSMELARERAYYILDNPFRNWLKNIVPKRDNKRKNEVCAEWRKTALNIVRKLGEELFNESGRKAFVGTEVKEKEKGKEVTRSYIAPKSYNKFIYSLETID